MLALTAALGATALLLGGCAKAPDAGKIEWTPILEQSIVGLDSTQSIYLQGGMLSGVTGGSQVDYRYAQSVGGGAIRESLVSSTFEAATAGSHKVSEEISYVVDIYEDSTAETAKLTVLECEADSPGKEKDASAWDLLALTYYPCVTSDGAAADYRVELHVPKGTVSQEFGGAPAPAEVPAADEPVPGQ